MHGALDFIDFHVLFYLTCLVNEILLCDMILTRLALRLGEGRTFGESLVVHVELLNDCIYFLRPSLDHLATCLEACLGCHY